MLSNRPQFDKTSYDHPDALLQQRLDYVCGEMHNGFALVIELQQVAEVGT